MMAASAIAGRSDGAGAELLFGGPILQRLVHHPLEHLVGLRAGE